MEISLSLLNVWTNFAPYHKHCCIVIAIVCCFVSLGVPVIQSPSEVIYRPGEGSIQLTCLRNTTAGVTGWRVNGSAALSSADIAITFPGHTDNGVNVVIVNATNNTKNVCVSLMDGLPSIDSEPVYLYIAGMQIISQSYIMYYVVMFLSTVLIWLP